MPLDHDNVTAAIEVTGVSLGCFNPATRNWEVAFINEPTHTLAVTITEVTAAGQTQLQGIPKIIRPDSRIDITANNPIPPRDPPFHFAPHDPEDFDLILDIEKEVYDNQRVIIKANPDFPVTKMFVSSALLYSVVGRLSLEPVKLVAVNDNQGTAIKRFGVISTTAGADIKCGEGGSVVFEVTGQGWENVGPVVLQRQPGTKYIITLDNTCPPDFSHFETRAADAPLDFVPGAVKRARAAQRVQEHTDFVIYYSVIDPPAGGDRFDLQEDVPPGRGPGLVCEYSHLGLTTNLF